MTAERTPPRSSSPARPRGIGALLHTDVEHVDLGKHRGRQLRARVEHRTVRLALGRRWSVAVTLGRRRATAVEVTPLPPGREAPRPGSLSAEHREVPVPHTADPWPRAARRLAVVALATWLLTLTAGRMRRARRYG